VDARHKAFAVVVLVLGAAACDPAPPGEPAAIVTVSPQPVVPFGPMTVGIRGTGCTPQANLLVHVYRPSPLSDAITPDPSHAVEVQADASGAWAAELPVPVAYPGRWVAEPGCDAPGTPFTVGTPASMAFTVTPDRIRRGEPATVELRGTGCGGTQVYWGIGGVPGSGPPVQVTGGGPVAADGTWRQSQEVTYPPDAPGGPRFDVVALCLHHTGLGRVVMVRYPTVSIVVDPVDPVDAGDRGRGR
jgi:hypothetical protein